MDFCLNSMDIIVFLGILRKENACRHTFFPNFVHLLILTVMKGNPMNKTMRTITMLLLSLLVMSCGVLSRNADDIINDLRDARHAQYVNVGSGLLGLGRLISPSLANVTRTFAINSASTSRISTRTAIMRRL